MPTTPVSLVTEDREIDGQTVKAGSTLAYDLSSLVGNDFFIGITYVGSSDYGDDYGVGDLLYALTQSGELYQFVIFENGGLLQNRIGNLGIQTADMNGSCMAYALDENGKDYLMYVTPDEVTSSPTVYAIGFDASGNLQAIKTSDFGKAAVTVVGCFSTQEDAPSDTTALTAPAEIAADASLLYAQEAALSVMEASR